LTLNIMLAAFQQMDKVEDAFFAQIDNSSCVAKWYILATCV